MCFRCMFHETIHRQQARVIFGVNYPISDNRRTISLALKRKSITKQKIPGSNIYS